MEPEPVLCEKCEREIGETGRKPLSWAFIADRAANLAWAFIGGCVLGGVLGGVLKVLVIRYF